MNSKPKLDLSFVQCVRCFDRPEGENKFIILQCKHMLCTKCGEKSQFISNICFSTFLNDTIFPIRFKSIGNHPLHYLSAWPKVYTVDAPSKMQIENFELKRENYQI